MLYLFINCVKEYMNFTQKSQGRLFKFIKAKYSHLGLQCAENNAVSLMSRNLENSISSPSAVGGIGHCSEEFFF